MGTYGRNFDFLQVPLAGERLGRYITGSTALPHGAPVVAGTTLDAERRRTLSLADNTTVPAIAKTGIVISEQAWTAYHGSDPFLTRPSDIDKAPAYTAAQLVHGTSTRVRLVNTPAVNFQGQRTYAARTMVAALGGLAVDDLLIPTNSPSDSNGYWRKKASPGDDATPGWLRVTAIDADNGICEAQFLF